MVLIFALLALAIAVPLGALGANAFTRFIAGLCNFDIVSYRISPQVLMLEVAVGLLIPRDRCLSDILRHARHRARSDERLWLEQRPFRPKSH